MPGLACVIIAGIGPRTILHDRVRELVHEAGHFAAPRRSIVSGGIGLEKEEVRRARIMFFPRVQQAFGPSALVLWRLVFFVLCAGSLVFGMAEIGVAQEPAVSPVSKSPVDQAEALLKEGKPRDAVSLLTEAARKDPKAPGLEGKLGKAYFQLRQFPEAAAHLQSALQQNAADLESSQLLALSFYSAGNYREALPLLEKLGPALPKNRPDAPYLISICYVMTQQWDSARKVLAQMFYVPPDSAMAYLALGKLLVRQQMVEGAETQIETALRLEPRLTMAHFLLGEIDLYRSNPRGAVAEFQKELAVNPTVWLVYWRLGEAYMQLENYDEAEKVLKKAVWLNEASPGAFILLGEIALKKKDPALASGFLERAVALDPQSFEAHSWLAIAYQELGREKDASQQFEVSRTLRNEKHNSGKDQQLPRP
jgi:tetratricopeptide (TPR) repeat protein